MTSPWPATAAHRRRESTSRCMRAASSLYRCAASRQPPRGERRWRGETERSQCCNGTVADGCRQCAILQRKFCKFFKVGKFGKFCKYASLARAVLALECEDSSVVSKVFEDSGDAPEILSKIFENLRQNLGPSKKTKIADGGENRGKPHWILWWTTWWPMDHGRRFWSSPIFGESFGRPADFSADKAKPYNL